MRKIVHEFELQTTNESRFNLNIFEVTQNKHTIGIDYYEKLTIECDLCCKELSCKTALLKHMRTVHKIANWTVANSKIKC